MKNFLIISILSAAAIISYSTPSYAGCPVTEVVTQEIEVTPSLDCLELEFVGSDCSSSIFLSAVNRCDGAVGLKQLEPECYGYNFEDFCEEMQILEPAGEDEKDEGEYVGEFEVYYPETEGTAILEGTYGDDTFEVSLAYKGKDVTGEQGCGCASTHDNPLTPATPLAVLGAAALFLRLRRRSV